MGDIRARTTLFWWRHRVRDRAVHAPARTAACSTGCSPRFSTCTWRFWGGRGANRSRIPSAGRAEDRLRARDGRAHGHAPAIRRAPLPADYAGRSRSGEDGSGVAARDGEAPTNSRRRRRADARCRPNAVSNASAAGARAALGAVYSHVFGLLAAALISLWRRGQASPSRAIARSNPVPRGCWRAGDDVHARRLRPLPRRPSAADRRGSGDHLPSSSRPNRLRARASPTSTSSSGRLLVADRPSRLRFRPASSYVFITYIGRFGAM